MSNKQLFKLDISVIELNFKLSVLPEITQNYKKYNLFITFVIDKINQQKF